jgi:galactose-1-phosphate uridylyltransferase
VLRYVASGELGGGLLANPVLPEQAASELRAAAAPVPDGEPASS